MYSSPLTLEALIVLDAIDRHGSFATAGDFVPLYIGYDPKSKVKYINVFDQGLIRLRATGQLSKILKRYGIHDWQAKGLN